jgi:CDP-diacylglycerol--glycerol-3-phosphate 3-phosphatidyltransferase
MRRRLPAALVALRLALGPAMVLVAWGDGSRVWLATMLLAAIVSDIFDGVLARRWGVATEALRAADSRVDMVFIGCAVAVLWRARTALLRPFLPALGLIGLAAAAGAAFDLAKYGRLASYHSYSAKASGLLLCASGLALLLAPRPAPLLALALAGTLASCLEHLAITLALPTWTCDVKGLAAALRMRRNQ